MSPKKVFIMLACLIAIGAGRMGAQNTGSISVNVKDQDTGQSLAGVNVMVVGTTLGAATNRDGVALIRGVPAGNRSIKITIVGFKEVQRPVTVEAGKTATVDVQMAQTELEFESVVVTATKGASLVTDVSAPTEVINAMKIASINAQNLGEVLNTSAGVFMKDYGAQGGLQSISIRGSSTSQVLVLVDGQRVSPANGSGIDFSTFATDNIEQIEVVRGGNSALYGADANGGIINIITKSGKYTEQPSGYAKFTLGSFSNKVFAANLGQHIDRFHYYATFRQAEVQSFEYKDNLGDEHVLPNTHNTATEGFLKMGVQISENSNLLFRSMIQRSQKGTNSLVFPSPEAKLINDRQDYGIVFNNSLTQRLRNKVQVYHNRLKTDYVDPGNFQPDPSINKDLLTGVEVEQQAIINTENVLTYGYNYRYEKVDGTNVVDVHRTENAGFVQLESEWKLSDSGFFNKIMFIPAGRYDNYSDFGSKFSPKVGLVISSTGEHKLGLRGNFGTSFRAPGFFDLYWPASFFFEGNPNLKPEKSTDYDAGLVGSYAKAGNLEYELTYYHSSLTNEISSAPGPTGVFTPQNLGSSKRLGVEVRLAVSPVKKYLRLEANYTYLKATNETEGSANAGKTLIYRPKNVLNFSATAHAGIFDATLVLHYIDKRYTNASNTRSAGAYGYLEGNLGFRYKRGNMEYFARVESNNLTNRSADVIAGFPQPKRTVGTTFGVSF